MNPRDPPPELVDEVRVAVGELGWIGWARMRVAAAIAIAMFFVTPDPVLEAIVDGYQEVTDAVDQ